jgi:hypothetical protein
MELLPQTKAICTPEGEVWIYVVKETGVTALSLLDYDIRKNFTAPSPASAERPASPAAPRDWK